MSDGTRPRIELTIAAPADVVWDALRDKDKIRHWLGWDYNGLDGEIDLIFFTETAEDASARTLRLHGGDEFRLDPHREGTRVTLTRAPRGDNPSIAPGCIERKGDVQCQPPALVRTNAAPETGRTR